MYNYLKLASLTLLSLLVFSCGDKTKTKDNKAELAKLKAEQKELQTKIASLEAASGKKETVRKVAVLVTSMVPTQFRSYVEIQGKVDADQSVVASPEVMGVVNAIYVHNGQYVSKGQTLATLRTEAISYGVAELDQQISFAKTLYEKQKRLWDQEIGTEIQLLSAKNNYEAMLKKKETTLSQKSMYTIKAPISGVVDEVDVRVGQAVSPGMPNLIRIVNTSILKVKAEVPENYAGKIQSGNAAMVVFPDINDTLITKLAYITKTIDPMSRTFGSEINLGNNSKYRPNMIAKVRIVTYQNLRAFVLPEAVIQKTENGNFVYVANAENKAQLLPVTLGNSYESKVEITSGLNLDDKVITTGYEELNEGDELQFEN